MNKDLIPTLLSDALAQLANGFEQLPATANTVDSAAIQAVLAEAASRLTDNYPYFHPLYAGQMLKPPHPAARAAYALAMAINPNNHALDGGRASSAMEMEAVSQIATMFGWPQHLGHLTSGGTFANLEALWISGLLAPGKRIVASEQAHYTHSRMCGVLKLDYASVASDACGRMDLNRLEDALKLGNVGTVVATMGSTAIGAVDPLHELLAFRIHADAAYGGYFRLIGSALAPQVAQAYQALAEADSVVVDPHKHGLQPYGCGSVLFRDPTVGRFYKHDSPYTYFTSSALHLGEISLECSRPGAAAVALWTTLRLLPLVVDGEFAQNLQKCRRAAVKMNERLMGDSRFIPLPGGPELDIVAWKVAAESVDASSARARTIFDEAAKRDLHLALVQLPASWFGPSGKGETLTCLRSVLMKPEHEAWLDEIWTRLCASC
jgi:tyrosine decarboxylase/aspartate 1-decarboxylase